MVALVLFVAAYGAARYGPHVLDAREVAALVAEAGERGARPEGTGPARSGRRERAVRAWFGEQAKARGLPWLGGDDLYWYASSQGVLLGVSWSVTVHHIGGSTHDVRFVRYCESRGDGCSSVRPEFEGAAMDR